MERCFRELTALSGVQDLIPWTDMLPKNHLNSISEVSNALFWLPMALHACSAHTQEDKIFVHINILKFI